MAGTEPQRPRVLVAFASKNGSTAEIAAAIAAELMDRGAAAQLVEAGAVGDLESFDAVVLGSAVYVRRWRRSARALLRRLDHELGDRPLWVFSSGPVGEAPLDPAWCEPAGMLGRARRLRLQGHVVFGGRVPAQPRNVVERAMARETPAEVADRRDWEEIRAWARSIARTLGCAPAPAPATPSRAGA